MPVAFLHSTKSERPHALAVLEEMEPHRIEPSPFMFHLPTQFGYGIDWAHWSTAGGSAGSVRAE